MADLLASYAELHMQEGYEESSTWSYGLNEFDNGVGLSPLARRLYLEFDDETRTRFGDPFATEESGSFFAWITREAEEGRRLSPFQEAVYRERYDVACAFPDVGGVDRARFVEWASTQGALEMGYSPALITGAPPAPRRRANPGPRVATGGLAGSLPAGVNVCGYIRNESGLGTHVRGLIDSLSRIGVQYALKDVSSLSVNRSDDTTVTDFDETHPYPINLVCINADQHFVVMAHDEAFFDGRYNIGIWNWELPSFPVEWYDRFEHYDEIWAGSSMIVNALAPVSPIPVVRIPPVLAARDVAGRESRRRELGRRALRLSAEETLYFFMFDFHSYFERKNPVALVRAFKRAFSPSDSARLVIKCLNGHADEQSLQKLYDEAQGHRVEILTEYVSREKVSQLLAASDVYVSLHRSEGIGLTMGEAMALGKPVVATAWSGNTDFMDVSNSFPVSFELVELERDVGPYRAGQIWSEPSVEHAAAIMRELFDTPEVGAVRGRAARDHVRRYFSPEQVARVMAERLAIIERRRKVVPKTHRRLPAHRHGNRDILEGLHRLVSSHVPADTPVAVVSRGDPELLAIGGCAGWHFPQTADGTYLGYHPSDSTAAITHLEALREKGAAYLLIPATSAWWLDYYAEFREHLHLHYELAVADATGTLYRLGATSPMVPAESATSTAPGNPLPEPGASGQSALFARLFVEADPNLQASFDEPAWSDAFVRWATGATGRIIPGTGLSPFLDLVYRLRSDVVAAFPDVQGAHRNAFAKWASTQGALEMGYDPKLATLPNAQDDFGTGPDTDRPADGPPAVLPGSDSSGAVEITLRILIEANGSGVDRVRVVPAGASNGTHP